MNIEKRKTWLILSVLLAVLIVTAAVLQLRWYLPSFPGLLLGQLQLTRDDAAFWPRNYQSSEFLLGQVPPSEIKGASLIHLQDDVLFWSPPYTGFPRTQLSQEEVQGIQDFLTGGKLITYEEGGYQCLDVPRAGPPTTYNCPEGEEIYARFNSCRFQAREDRAVGLLLLELQRGQIAEIRLFPGEGCLAIWPVEMVGPWFLDGYVPQSFPLLEAAAGRVALEPVPVIWPRLTAEQANARAEHILGTPYRKALEFALGSAQVGAAFGEIVEIRPAQGANRYSHWMDSSSVTATFSVVGSRAEGAVLVQGEECFQIWMVVEGIPAAEDQGYICP